MGFGTLFIGYFFLVNISFFGYTDIISALFMMMGFYQLSRFNKPFKNAMLVCMAFCGIAALEFIFEVIGIFSDIGLISTISSYISVIRYCLIFGINVFMMRGIHDIADEVAANSLAALAKASLPLSVVYLVAALFSLPFASSIIGNAVAYIYFVILIAIFAYVLSSLIVIYKAYAQICMPGDEDPSKKASKIDPLGKFFAKMEQSGREYAEYKIKKDIEKANKKKEKRK